MSKYLYNPKTKIIYYECRPIATVLDETSFEQVESMIRTLNTAPELLEALKWAKRCLEDEYNNPQIGTESDATIDCRNAIDFAISRATGE
jgi:hypothetical protein